MPILQAGNRWTFTSTGTGKFVPTGEAESLTFGIQTSSGCTASVQIVHRMGSTTALNSSATNFVLSTLQCTVADAVTDQYLGPFDYVAPRVKDMTAGSTHVITVRLKAV